MTKSRALAYLLLIVLAGSVGYMTFSWYRTLYGGDPYGAPFELVDQRGQTITEQAFRGQPTAVFFGFTHCPEVCPTTLFELDGWMTALGDEGADMDAYFVSVDPERDTPEVLDNYISNVSSRIIGITGPPDRIAEMTREFGIFSKRVALDDGDYTMDHTASIILLDSAGAFFGTIAYGENPDTAVAKLKRLVNEG